MSIYRRIYEQHHGPIPVDNTGKTYDIHHIDGNHNNNDVSNLIALSVVDHFWEHWINGEYGACYKISKRIKLTPEEQSELGRISNIDRIENRTHNFLKPGFQRETQRRLVENGTHHLLGGELHKQLIKDGRHNFLGEKNPSIARIKNGTHHFLDSEYKRKNSMERVEKGTHHFLNPKKLECPHCGKIGNLGPMKQWHFDKCKQKP